MNRIWTGCLTLFVLLAVAKVLIAQPMEENAGSMAPSAEPVVVDEMVGNAMMMNEMNTMNEEMGMPEGNMEMHKEMGMPSGNMEMHE